MCGFGGGGGGGGGADEAEYRDTNAVQIRICKELKVNVQGRDGWKRRRLSFDRISGRHVHDHDLARLLQRNIDKTTITDVFYRCWCLRV